MRHFLTKFVLITGSFALLQPTLAVIAANQGRFADGQEFGPVVRAYLGYLRNEQEVVDDRVSRREVSQAYYRRNSNRIRALRQMAIRIARESRNDYLPELEAVARDEMGLLFERPPRPEILREGEILRGTFRFLGVVHLSEGFYVFARLDPYEQAELKEKADNESQLPVGQKAGSDGLTRAKRATSP
ncbi:MAG: hypothetical protein ACREBG_10880 [Pyrinomonadaceae bacterium]